MQQSARWQRRHLRQKRTVRTRVRTAATTLPPTAMTMTSQAGTARCGPGSEDEADELEFEEEFVPRRSVRYAEISSLAIAVVKLVKGVPSISSTPSHRQTKAGPRLRRILGLFIPLRKVAHWTEERKNGCGSKANKTTGEA